jgi:hypothetical protein
MEVSSMEEHDCPSEDRRDFIAKCGRFAVVTPPAIALMLSASGRNYAHAMSGARGRGDDNDQGDDNDDQ